ncbi:nitrile hydratase accessory protein [Streptomyces sp. AK02-01A]|uniref:nitrile hydratase accessory protein n=1 Tax=Streptomyces sp. AK02-01A TaxID=3028648 RepID=UPI00299FF027|nr:nitrile hydratase accessory protein [Streptomyces sp. AK02-01A]MDX3854854.1 nitrile hydratase accessory protein [Streptomyces sp. AK02-01A]
MTAPLDVAGPAAPLDVEGPAAPPRSNGELVFAEPWESRAFGMAVTLYEAGAFTWPRFQAALTARIADWEALPTEGRRWNYYPHWLGALEDVLTDGGTVLADEVTTRAGELSRRPVGFDHPNDHESHPHGERPTV